MQHEPCAAKKMRTIIDIFLDPDLLPMLVTQDEVDTLAASLPELPDDIRDRLIGDYGLSAYDASVITEERETALYYEEASTVVIAS